MQVAHKDAKGKYKTVKDDQVKLIDKEVLIHPSSSLAGKAEWVVYNEFVLTKRNYIRTCTAIKPEWLISMAPEYYNPDHFPETDTKRELQRLQARIVKKGKKHNKR